MVKDYWISSFYGYLWHKKHDIIKATTHNKNHKKNYNLKKKISQTKKDF
jgi:hypothetical protein